MMTTARGGGERSRPARLVHLLRRSVLLCRTIHRMIQRNENTGRITE
nr:MAG TPA: SERTA motif [Caudoviricetes sp.]